MDAPLVFDDENQEVQYRPGNDDNRFNGPTRLREALYRSINLVSMRVFLEVGANAALAHAGRFGFDTASFPRNTQLAIGGGTMAVTPMQMATAYTVFANGGYQVTPHIVQRVLDINGNAVFEAKHPQVCKACERELRRGLAPREGRGSPTLLAEAAAETPSAPADEAAPEKAAPPADSPAPSS